MREIIQKDRHERLSYESNSYIAPELKVIHFSIEGGVCTGSPVELPNWEEETI